MNQDIEKSQDATHGQSRDKKLSLLVDAFKILSGTLDFDVLLRKIAALMIPTIADWVAIDIVDEKNTLKRLTVVHRDPDMEDLVREVDEVFPPDPNAPNYRVAKTGRAEFFPDITDKMVVEAAKNDEELRVLRQLALCSIMFLPIIARGATMGTVTLAYAESKRHYTDDDLEFVSDFCNHIGVLLENAKLYQAIERENRTRERFLAVLSHELRNPLAPIKHSLELLKLKNENSDLQGEIDIIDHQFGHLSKLLHDLLDMNRLIHGRYSLKKVPVELNALLRTVTATVEFMTKKKGIDLSLDVPPYETWISIDPVRIEQVLINLLHNAEKFTPVGGAIRATVKQENNMAIIEIADNGIGIDKDDIGKIFDIYFQGTNPDAYTSGLGMGLLLAREIVNLHGGTIEARSEGPGLGSVFIIHLPFNVPAKQDESESTAADDDGAGTTREFPGRKKILIIDDNRNAADALAKLLRLVGYETKVAYGGQDGVETFRRFSPDVAIIDLGMSELDGYGVAEALRKEHQTKIPLIALSGYGMSEDVKRALAAGFDRHLTKPAGLDDIKEILRTYGL